MEGAVSKGERLALEDDLLSQIKVQESSLRLVLRAVGRQLDASGG